MITAEDTAMIARLEALLELPPTGGARDRRARAALEAAAQALREGRGQALALAAAEEAAAREAG